MRRLIVHPHKIVLTFGELASVKFKPCMKQYSEFKFIFSLNYIYTEFPIMQHLPHSFWVMKTEAKNL